MIAQTHAHGVLFGMVPIEMMDEVVGHQHILHLMLSFVKLQEGELFPKKGSSVTFFQFNFFVFVSFLALDYASRITHFLVSSQHRHSELL